MASNLFSAIFRLDSKPAASPPNFPYTIKTNPYRCKRPWPPDFSQLSQRHQFLLERRFRRRSKLKWARPTWNKAVKITQWGTILFVCVYGVFFLDVQQARGDGHMAADRNGTVFDGARQWYAEQMRSFRGQRDAGPATVPAEARRGRDEG